MENRSEKYSIVADNLVRKFGSFTAVNKVSFKVKEGEIFGLLGPNGAGKTTTISMLSTIIGITSGSATINGKDVKKEKDAVRNLIGIVFQDPSLDEDLTGMENLDFHARLYSVKGKEKKDSIAKVLKLVELEDKANTQVKNYSGGMKRRLEIARGFIHNPKVLFLDEPTIGLDPQTRRKIWDYVQKLNRETKLTIMLTTHYIEEADELCNRVAIIDHGRIIKMDTPEKLKDSLGGDIIRIGSDNQGKLAELIKKSKFATSVKERGNDIEVTTKNGSKAIPEIIGIAKDHRIEVAYTTLKRPTLEDVFISLTGKEIREEGASDVDKLKRNFRFRGRR
jgi:ABC-2 type transport system ATP-binding protein